MQTLLVRAATAHDLPRLASLWYENTVLQQQADRRLKMAPDGEARWTLAATAWLADPQARIVVADRGDGVIGYAVGRVEAGPSGLLPEQRGVILELAIDAHGYHAGVGRELIGALRQWFKGQGAEEFIVHVTRRHAVEQAFWRALGAKEWIDCLSMKC
jgi:GNAT superfamily N-acetyltransferase